MKCDVQKFDFSAHADSRGLFDIIDRVQPETVLAVHGERCEEFAKNIQETTGIKAYAPKNKDVFNF